MIIYKELTICFYFVNYFILIQSQMIQYHNERCTNNIDEDFLTKLRELQSEFIAYREWSIDQLTKMENKLSNYRNESTEKQRELQSIQHASQRQLQERITQLQNDLDEYRNDTVGKQKVLEDELNRQGKGKFTITIIYNACFFVLPWTFIM